MPTIAERFENLALIKETLMDERKFYMKRKEWPKVTIRNRALKALDEQVARVRHLKMLAA